MMMIDSFVRYQIREGGYYLSLIGIGNYGNLGKLRLGMDGIIVFEVPSPSCLAWGYLRLCHRHSGT